MTLTYLQKLWLRSRGDRDEGDVIVINDINYVIMTDSYGNKYFKIPDDKEIRKDYHIKYKKSLHKPENIHVEYCEFYLMSKNKTALVIG